MKEYYYLTGKDKNGPYSIAEIKTKSLSFDTFVWTEGMDNWQKIIDLPELHQELNAIIPPPVPAEVLENYEDDQPIKGNWTKPKEKKTTSEKVVLTRLIYWCSFHLFALLMSFTKINFFNAVYKSKADEFWPFVRIFHTVTWNDVRDINPEYIEEVRKNVVGNTEFNGIFYHYDWTEFLFYVGCGLLIYLIRRLKK